MKTPVHKFHYHPVALSHNSSTKCPALADHDHDGACEMAKKLMKYSVFMPEYIASYKDTDVGW